MTIEFQKNILDLIPEEALKKHTQKSIAKKAANFKSFMTSKLWFKISDLPEMKRTMSLQDSITVYENNGIDGSYAIKDAISRVVHKAHIHINAVIIYIDDVVGHLESSIDEMNLAEGWISNFGLDYLENLVSLDEAIKSVSVKKDVLKQEREKLAEQLAIIGYIFKNEEFDFEKIKSVSKDDVQAYLRRAFL